ncbi:hypothetical protein GCM10025876_26820 [Demequina litorisediminis]|uniref:FtsK domain-containing protein n=2 Tax=Demequina litorisediminis TaxID=1849022 RepID=A0ABQ6IH45_9MICO|nr:hypothetical protein GCM10025876_26820 [Demequina litorisediminis]
MLAAITGRWWLALVVVGLGAAVALAPLLRARHPREEDPAPRTPAGPLAIRGDGSWARGYARAVAIDRGRRLDGVAAEPWMRWLDAAGDDDRVALLADGDDVPSWCTATVDVGATGVSVTAAGVTHMAGPLRLTRARAETAARRLAGAHTPPALPRAVTWADLPSPAPPPPSRRRRTVRATLGMGKDGPVLLDLDDDGPHVLVAGTTGAGKSVALETLIMSLAHDSGPEDLAIALIDFKGGAGLAGCRDLPHVCGTLSDLDGSLAGRALEGVAAELRARKQALAEQDLTSMHAWEERGGAPPRLLIVIDEYQEITALLPDFIPEMARLAAQGRSLGLHLVMATQRPAGAVTPAVRANIGATLALRVASEGESRDLLGTADAAEIPRDCPGRAVLLTGGTLTPLQTASPHAHTTPAVAPVGTPPATPRLLSHRVRQRWAHNNPPQPLWLPPLPPHFEVPRTQQGEPWVAALVDLPRERRQETLTWDPRDGALVVVGPRRDDRAGVWRAVAAQAARDGLATVVVPQDPREAARTLALAGRRDVLVVMDEADTVLAALGAADDGAAADAWQERLARGLPTVIACTAAAPSRLARGAGLVLLLGPIAPAAATTWGATRDATLPEAPGRAWAMGQGRAVEAQLAHAPAAESRPLVTPLPRRHEGPAWGVGGDDACPWSPPSGPTVVVGPAGRWRSAVAASIGAHATESETGALAPSEASVVLIQPTARAVRLAAPLDHAGIVDPAPVPHRVVVIAAGAAVAVQLRSDLGVEPGVENDSGGRGDRQRHDTDA